jgi:hypothetical protein
VDHTDPKALPDDIAWTFHGSTAPDGLEVTRVEAVRLGAANTYHSDPNVKRAMFQRIYDGARDCTVFYKRNPNTINMCPKGQQCGECADAEESGVF